MHIFCCQYENRDGTFRAVFIRAPAVLEIGPGVEVMASYKLSPEEQVREVGMQTSTAFHKSHTLGDSPNRQPGASMMCRRETQASHHTGTQLQCRPLETPRSTACLLSIHVALRGVRTTAAHSCALQASQGRPEVAVAVRSGVLLATAFHPELTTDLRW